MTEGQEKGLRGIQAALLHQGWAQTGETEGGQWGTWRPGKPRVWWVALQDTGLRPRAGFRVRPGIQAWSPRAVQAG